MRGRAVKPLPLGRCSICGGTLQEGFMSLFVGVYPMPGEPDMASSLVLVCFRCTGKQVRVARLAYLGRTIPRMPPTQARFRDMMRQLRRRADGVE